VSTKITMNTFLKVKTSMSHMTKSTRLRILLHLLNIVSMNPTARRKTTRARAVKRNIHAVKTKNLKLTRITRNIVRAAKVQDTANTPQPA